MGYSEVYCQLCGVSFNIGRIRTDNEPPEAGWGGPHGETYVTTIYDYGHECPPESGCRDVLTDDGEEQEHVAGSDCTLSMGYSGARISVEEMVGCKTAQALTLKRGQNEPSPDDLEYERSSKWFLTGLCSDFPERGGDQCFRPGRHGLREDEEVVADDMFLEDDDGIPFHPTCFDIFTRVSRLRLGFVDINGLVAWRNSLESMGTAVEHDESVKRAQQGFWLHGQLGGPCGHFRIPFRKLSLKSSSEPDQEYLASNPVLVPALPAILKAALRLDDPSFSVQNSAFPYTSSSAASMDPHSTPNVLERLPQELIMKIVDHLDSRDIASLRLAVRGFNRLPISLWHTLLKREAPWLYEAWDDAETSPWVTPCTEIFAALDEEKGKNARKRKRLDEEEAGNAETKLFRPWKTPETVKLPALGTDWYLLCMLISRHWGELKGLQNRKRIWKAVEQIVGHIQRLSEGGKNA